LVILLLNLSAIPDDVVRGLHFGPGFVEDFKESFNAYKIKFERKYAEKWELTNDQLIERYLLFK